MESVRFERMVRPIELVNRLISIWPLEGNKYPIESRIRRFHRVLMFVLVSILSIAVSFDVMHHWGSMHEVTECALIASAFYLSTLRLAVYTIHEEELKYVVHTMKTDWFESCKEDIAMLKKKCMFGFQLGKHFIVTVVVALTVFILAPALQIIFGGTDERVLPFRGYFFRNQINSPYYEYLYAFEIIAGLLGGSTISAATSLNLIITMHAAAKFSIVCEKLKSLKSDDINIKDHFANCVRLHQDAILFADRAENVINILALGQFVISTGLLCFAGFQLTSMAHDKGQMMKYITFLNSAILELFIFSYSGNQLIIESEAIGESIYESDWIGGNYMQNINIIMLRSITPNKITAGKFYDMSLKSFASVLSTSFSYFTVLQAVNGE